MQPSGKAGELFAAFSRTTAKAFADERLIACPTLSKAPNYGDVLRRFLTGAPHEPCGVRKRLNIALRYCLNNFGHFFFLVLVRLYISALRWKLPAALSTGAGGTDGQRAAPEAFHGVPHEAASPETKALPFIIDTFALLPGIAGKGSYQEGYLPGLYEAAGKSRRPVRFYRLYGTRHPTLTWKAMNILARNGEGFTDVHLFTWEDWFLLLRHICVYPFALRRLIRSLGQFPPESPEAYIHEALIATSGQNAVTGESRRLAGLRLGRLLAPHAVSSTESNTVNSPLLVSWYENQTVDKALHKGLRQAASQSGARIPTLGAQLLVWPDTLLNNHPDDGEAALGLAPDRVLVNGPWFLPESSTQDYAVGPALRYNHLFFLEETRTAGTSPAPGAPPASGSHEASGKPKNAETSGAAADIPALPLLALLSYHPEEIERVLALLLTLSAKGVSIVYKFHPATRPESFSRLLPPTPRLSSAPLMDALAGAGAVIGSGSGSLAEAAALGIPVLAVRDPSGIPGMDLHYLPPMGQGQLWENILHDRDIEPALARLSAFRATPGHAAAVKQLKAALFTPPTPETIRNSFGL